MKVLRSILIPPPDKETSILNAVTVYPTRSNDILFQEYGEVKTSDTFGNYWCRFSDDGGLSWSVATPTFVPEETPEGTVRIGETVLLFDEKTERLLHFSNLHLYPGGHHTREVVGLTTVQHKVSVDGGRTFSKPVQVIVDGMSPKNWAPGVQYGENSIMVSFSSAFCDRQGRIILPCQRFCVVSQDVRACHIPLEAGCLIGEWTDGGGIRWQIGDMVKADLSRSSRGVFEPAVAELEDGQFLMICRGSNAGLENVPGWKWKSISTDGGFTWSTPEPWTFDDGSSFYSPSSGSWLIRHSQNGKLYWIGNICVDNPEANSPRHPLKIAEVDEVNLTLIRSSVSLIDGRGENESEQLQISNFRVYEDRITHEIVITLARLFADYTKSFCAPATQYRVNVL